MAEVKLSSKNQIVIPREVRDQLGLKAGTKLIVVAMGDVLIVRRKPKNYADAIRGIGKGLYPPGYLENERKSWE